MECLISIKVEESSSHRIEEDRERRYKLIVDVGVNPIFLGMGLVDERRLKYKDGGGVALPTHQFILAKSLFGSYCYWFRLVHW